MYYIHNIPLTTGQQKILRSYSKSINYYGRHKLGLQLDETQTSNRSQRFKSHDENDMSDHGEGLMCSIRNQPPAILNHQCMIYGICLLDSVHTGYMDHTLRNFNLEIITPCRIISPPLPLAQQPSFGPRPTSMKHPFTLVY
jgi:hypothetical protein